MVRVGGLSDHRLDPTIVVPLHDYSFSWPLSLFILSLFSVASIFSVLAFKYAATLAARLSLGILLVFYVFFFVATCWQVAEHVLA
jgi:hypothetical protein